MATNSVYYFIERASNIKIAAFFIAGLYLGFNLANELNQEKPIKE